MLLTWTNILRIKLGRTIFCFIFYSSIDDYVVIEFLLKTLISVKYTKIYTVPIWPPSLHCAKKTLTEMQALRKDKKTSHSEIILFD